MSNSSPAIRKLFLLDLRSNKSVHEDFENQTLKDAEYTQPSFSPHLTPTLSHDAPTGRLSLWLMNSPGNVKVFLALTIFPKNL